MNYAYVHVEKACVVLLKGDYYMEKEEIEQKNKYAKEMYDDVRLQVKKGSKEKVRTYASSQGLSLQEYIRKLIKDDSDIDV